MNQEQQLQAIRFQWRESRTLDTDEHIDWLFRLIDERDAIIHDLTLDGSALARRAVDEHISRTIEHLLRLEAKEDSEYYSAAMHDAINWLEKQTANGGGTAPDPLPPDQARAEAERLRAILRAIREQIGIFLDVFTHYQEQWPGLEPAMKTLSRMASEDTP